MLANLKKSAVATGLEKFSFHSNPKEEQCQRMFKLLHCCTHFPCTRLCSKSFKLGFCNTWTKNLQTYKMGLEKAEEPDIKLPTFVGSWRKQVSSSKTSISASSTMLKPLTVWITTNCRKFFKRWEYQTTLPVSCETCMWVKKQQLEPAKEQWTGSKFWTAYKAVYCHPDLV